MEVSILSKLNFQDIIRKLVVKLGIVLLIAEIKRIILLIMINNKNNNNCLKAKVVIYIYNLLI